MILHSALQNVMPAKHNIVFQRAATLNPDLVVSSIFFSSGLIKIIHPPSTLWPQFPKCFWLSVGLWELTGSSLMFSKKSFALALAFPLLYMFLGGAFYALLCLPPTIIKDKPIARRISLVPSTVSLITLIYCDCLSRGGFHLGSIVIPFAYLALGFLAGHGLRMTRP